MRITCDLIRDLLPLYRDGVCSDESKEIIREHLKSCENCQEELRLMEAPLENNNITDEDERVIKASSAAWKKRKNRSFIIGCIAALLVIILAIGSYVAVHWFFTANENDVAALTQQAADYFDDVILDVLKVEQRGNYLALLYTSESGNLGMCVFDRDNLFSDRWKASGGKSNFREGEIVSWNFGSSNREAVLIFCGANIPEKASWYTFQNSDITYICPIKNGEVLDVFVIQDSNNINGYPILLDNDKEEIE